MFEDERGKLIFVIKNNNFISKETTVSVNNKDVFRGVHIEDFEKLVTCIEGKMLDITINFNEYEEDYLIPKYVELIANTPNNQLLVKKNHGHAYLTLTENTIVLYNFGNVFDSTKTKTINYKDPILNIKLPINNPIISEKDLNAPFIRNIDYVVYGGNGFIGSSIIDELIKHNKKYYKSNLRLEDTNNIEKELELYKPRYVINSAGITGTPNISWCETNRIQTIETNVTYQLTLAKICYDKKIHLTVISSGAIFNGDKFYNEDENGNYDGNFYGKCRIYLENMLKNYDNVLYIRVNYPISSKKSNKNLLTKLLNYKIIENKELTITYIDELVGILIRMIEHNELGICNFVNEGSINLTKILNIYNEYQEHKYEISQTIDTNKSNSLLMVGKLKKYNVSKIEDAVRECIVKYISKE